MNNIIQHSEENGIPELEKIYESFSKAPKDIAGFVYGMRDFHLRIAAKHVGDSFTAINTSLRKSAQRKRHWKIVRTDSKTLTTSIGDITYQKTLFEHKETGIRKYLVDQVLGLKPGARMTEDAEAQMLEEAVRTSYRRGGEAASILSRVSKETVKDHLHELEFPEEAETAEPVERRKIDRLFIEADEDHIHLQFKKRKGDLRADKLGRKMNSAIVKLIYVHEGIEPEAPKSKRHRLIKAHYFAGTYEGEDNKVLWDEVYEYIIKTYDIDSIKKIYLNSDGGEWIKAGARRLHGITRVMDEFHLRERVLGMTRHVDGIDKNGHPAMDAILDTIRRDTKEDFISYVDMLMFHAGENELTWRRVSDGADYILNNWMAAKVRLAYRDSVCGSSTEAHVCHVLSTRMSNKPMGWSRLGADKMARLRAYYWNKGSMIELVRYQNTREELPKVAGAELDPISSAQIRLFEYEARSEEVRYYERMQATLGESIRKAFRIVINKYL